MGIIIGGSLWRNLFRGGKMFMVFHRQDKGPAYRNYIIIANFINFICNGAGDRIEIKINKIGGAHVKVWRSFQLAADGRKTSCEAGGMLTGIMFLRGK